MNNGDLIKLCLGNLRRRRARTILAIIGVVIGTCAIVVMMSLGTGLTLSYQAQIESYGNLHLINVYNYGGTDANGNQVYLNDNAVKTMGKISGVTAISPVENQYLTIAVGKQKAELSVNGMRLEMMEKFGYKTKNGRIPSSSDENGVVMGSGVLSWFYNPKTQQGPGWGGETTFDPTGEDIVLTGDYSYLTRDEGKGDLKWEYFEGICTGVLDDEGSESAYSVYMDINQLQEIKASIDKTNGSKGSNTNPAQKNYGNVQIYVDDISKISEICAYIKDELGFQTSSLNDWLDSVKDTMKMIEAVLGGIGGISLFVAAIGIANTMIMSVYERTREIGVMKVIGAEISDIRKMFLVESGMIGFFGGIAGLVLSFAISITMNQFISSGIFESIGFYTGEGARVSVITAPYAIGAVIFATLIGLLSGYLPATRAMNLSALESLKNE